MTLYHVKDMEQLDIEQVFYSGEKIVITENYFLENYTDHKITMEYDIPL